MQFVLGGELFVADLTHKRHLVGRVDVLVLLERSVGGERLAARVTHERNRLRCDVVGVVVALPVSLQALLGSERLATLHARHGDFVVRVLLDAMRFQVVPLGKVLSAELANERFQTFVGSFVGVQSHQDAELLRTLVALVNLHWFLALLFQTAPLGSFLLRLGLILRVRIAGLCFGKQRKFVCNLEKILYC